MLRPCSAQVFDFGLGDVGIGNFSVGLPVQFFEPGQFKEGPFVSRRLTGGSRALNIFTRGGPEWLDTVPVAKVTQEAQQAGKK
jgi:hypothetical protein